MAVPRILQCSPWFCLFFNTSGLILKNSVRKSPTWVPASQLTPPWRKEKISCGYFSSVWLNLAKNLSHTKILPYLTIKPNQFSVHHGGKIWEVLSNGLVPHFPPHWIVHFPVIVKVRNSSLHWMAEHDNWGHPIPSILSSFDECPIIMQFSKGRSQSQTVSHWRVGTGNVPNNLQTAIVHGKDTGLQCCIEGVGARLGDADVGQDLFKEKGVCLSKQNSFRSNPVATSQHVNSWMVKKWMVANSVMKTDMDSPSIAVGKPFTSGASRLPWICDQNARICLKLQKRDFSWKCMSLFPSFNFDFLLFSLHISGQKRKIKQTTNRPSGGCFWGEGHTYLFPLDCQTSWSADTGQKQVEIHRTSWCRSIWITRVPLHKCRHENVPALKVSAPKVWDCLFFWHLLKIFWFFKKEKNLGRVSISGEEYSRGPSHSAPW